MSDKCQKCGEDAETHAADWCKPSPPAKATGAMRSREEWAEWLLKNNNPDKILAASDFYPEADFILSAITAERERARKEALESIRAFAKGGLVACTELDDKDGAAAYKSVMDDCDRDLGRILRLNRQRESGKHQCQADAPGIHGVFDPLG